VLALIRLRLIDGVANDSGMATAFLCRFHFTEMLFLIIPMNPPLNAADAVVKTGNDLPPSRQMRSSSQ